MRSLNQSGPFVRSPLCCPVLLHCWMLLFHMLWKHLFHPLSANQKLLTSASYFSSHRHTSSSFHVICSVSVISVVSVVIACSILSAFCFWLQIKSLSPLQKPFIIHLLSIFLLQAAAPHERCCTIRGFSLRKTASRGTSLFFQVQS